MLTGVEASDGLTQTPKLFRRTSVGKRDSQNPSGSRRLAAFMGCNCQLEGVKLRLRVGESSTIGGPAMKTLATFSQGSRSLGLTNGPCVSALAEGVDRPDCNSRTLT